jgi:hypothetical protein
MRQILIALLVLAALPLAADPKQPAYRQDPRLAVALPGAPGAPLSFDRLEAALGDVPVVVPGVIAGADILLGRDKRTATDAFEWLADFSLGHWEKVGAAWVLVMDRPMIAIAEMTHAQQEQAARELLRRLWGTLDERRRGILLQGGVLSQANLTIAARQSLSELGELGYWRTPYQVSPSAVRGSGTTLRLVGGQVTVMLALRRGSQAYPWVGIPAAPGGSG